METYRVRVTKDYLGFCSAHFIVFHQTQCERLHGHNYRVGAELEGPLDEDFLVFDFIELKRVLRGITDELDHRMLVPVKASKLSVETGETEVRIAFGEKRWIFPRGDCALVPVENTTAELLARHVARRLQEELEKSGRTLENGKLQAVRIEIEETPGQSAFYEVTAPRREP